VNWLSRTVIRVSLDRVVEHTQMNNAASTAMDTPTIIRDRSEILFWSVMIDMFWISFHNHFLLTTVVDHVTYGFGSTETVFNGNARASIIDAQVRVRIRVDGIG